MSFITLQEFTKHMNIIKNIHDELEPMYDIFGIESKVIELFHVSYDETIDLFCMICGNVEIITDYINWWIYECNFGKNNTKIYDEENNIIADLSSIDELYYYIKIKNLYI